MSWGWTILWAGLAQTEVDTELAVTPLAYLETYLQWNFSQPANGVTHARGFDHRHASFALANAALGGELAWKQVFGRLVLQVGSTPDTYYLSEPNLAGAAATSGSSAATWKYLQEARLGYKFGDQTQVSAGLYLSPIGPESIAVKDNWNWSRSNLFFGLPFYHTGVRAQHSLDTWTFTAGAYNGMNSVIDNNTHKSIHLQATWNPGDTTVSFLYFGGVERNPGGPEGEPWRHLFDLQLTWRGPLTVMLHADGGFESHRLGTSAWMAGAAYFRLPWDTHALTARVDYFREIPGENGLGRATPIFWPVAWVTSGTLTFETRFQAHLALYLEMRHDRAAAPLYFGSEPATEPNRDHQTTLTLGATAWY